MYVQVCLALFIAICARHARSPRPFYGTAPQFHADAFRVDNVVVPTPHPLVRALHTLPFSERSSHYHISRYGGPHRRPCIPGLPPGFTGSYVPSSSSLRPSLPGSAGSSSSVSRDRSSRPESSGFDEKFIGMTMQLERSIFLVGFAVIVSAIVEARSSHSLPQYHAIVILNISQVNHWGGFMLLFIRTEAAPKKHGRRRLLKQVLISAFKPTALLSITHSVLMSAFGLWFWLSTRGYSRQFNGYTDHPFVTCRPETTFWVFGIGATPSSSQALRWISVAYYALNLIPGLGLCIQLYIAAMAIFFVRILLLVGSLVASYVSIFLHNAVSFFTNCSRIHSHEFSQHFPEATHMLIEDLALIAPLLYTIITTEQTIRKNSPYLIGQSENVFTYGQISALFAAGATVLLFAYDIWILSGELENDRAWPLNMLRSQKGIATTPLVGSSRRDRRDRHRGESDFGMPGGQRMGHTIPTIPAGRTIPALPSPVWSSSSTLYPAEDTYTTLSPRGIHPTLYR